MPRLPDAGQNTGDRAGRALPSGPSPRALSQYMPPALPGCTGYTRAKKTGRQYPPGSARGNAPPILRIKTDYACAPVSLRPYPACLSIMSFTFIRRTWVLRSFSSSFMTM